jgi:hypothetical protein
MTGEADTLQALNGRPQAPKARTAQDGDEPDVYETLARSVRIHPARLKSIAVVKISECPINSKA